MKHTLAAGLLALATIAGGTASAADLPTLHVTGVGLNSGTIASSVNEVPFWNKTVPADSGGKITVTFSPMDIMGVAGNQVMSMTNLGVVDFGASDISKMAGDNPVFEGCDLAGLALDVETARKACEAWLPVMSEAAEKQFGIKLLALGANPPQVVWCRDKITGLADLKGKKIRVFNQTMTDFVEAVGATAVNIPFAEVVPALQRGVVDCAVTGSLSGNTAGWTEVATHQFGVYMGWAVNYQSVNLKSWERFGPEARAFFEKEFSTFTEEMWKTVTDAVQDADDCNFGGGSCDLGKVANPPLTNVPVSDADKAEHAKLMQDVVLVKWGKRAGKENAQKWNDTVGKVVGLTIPLDKL